MHSHTHTQHRLYTANERSALCILHLFLLFLFLSAFGSILIRFSILWLRINKWWWWWWQWTETISYTIIYTQFDMVFSIFTILFALSRSLFHLFVRSLCSVFSLFILGSPHGNKKNWHYCRIYTHTYIYIYLYNEFGIIYRNGNVLVGLIFIMFPNERKLARWR